MGKYGSDGWMGLDGMGLGLDWDGIFDSISVISVRYMKEGDNERLCATEHCLRL